MDVRKPAVGRGVRKAPDPGKERIHQNPEAARAPDTHAVQRVLLRNKIFENKPFKNTCLMHLWSLVSRSLGNKC